jgi:hypothetical protein
LLSHYSSAVPDVHIMNAMPDAFCRISFDACTP